MNNPELKDRIERPFRERVRKDKKVRNAYLLVHSEKLNLHINIAEGKTGEFEADPGQAVHLASVGKLFTAVLTGVLYEKGKLDYNDPIGRHLEKELVRGLNVYRGRDYSGEITVRHLLMQTSGLNDVFYHLLKKMMKDPSFKAGPREAVLWGKENLRPKARPGKKFFYTDTNYYLLGLIIESITGEKFHQAMSEMIFEPLKMNRAFIHGFSEPLLRSEYPVAGLFIKNVNLLSIEGIHKIDYAGGSLIAPLEEYLVFMRALVNQEIIKRETLDRMIEDDVYMGFPTIGFNYGYSVWKPKRIPVLMPQEYYCWGCVGVTGAFMFYHPSTESHIIGTFNDYSYRGRALTFMFKRVIKPLLRAERDS